MIPSTNSSSPSRSRSSGFSLTELLIVIAIIGVTTLISVPMITNLLSKSKETLSRQNAQRAVSVSGQLSAIGVAHVLPESLGGVEATLRLLRRGISVPDGPMQGKYFTVGEISDENIASASVFMEIVFETKELQLGYNPNATP